MRRRTGLLFTAPALVLFGVFVLYPMVSAFSYAFFRWQGTARGGFAGLENFTALFTRAPFTTDLPQALIHNLLFFLGTMLVQNTVGLAIAYLLHRRDRSRRALQTLYAMPYLVSPIVIGYLWYDFMHWSTHYRPPSTERGKALRAHHMAHHFADPDKNFGISHMWMDALLGTSLKRGKEEEKAKS